MILYQFDGFGSFANKSPASFEWRLLKVLKIDWVYLTIWYSARTSTIHPPDLLVSPSDLIAFHKSLGLLIHFEFLFSFLQWDFAHYIVLFYKPLYLHEACIFLYFFKSFFQIISFSEISLSNHSWEFLLILLLLTGATLSMTSISFWMKFE